jgi:hypothetical protein
MKLLKRSEFVNPTGISKNVNYHLPTPCSSLVAGTENSKQLHSSERHDL